MFQGVLTLLSRSLREDARSLPAHLARFGLLTGIYISLITMTQRAFWFSAPGLNFLYGVAYLNLAFMSLLGISFFSTAISEEKEEDTLGLMQMAGISPLGILLGKVGGRIVQAFSLVIIQYPMTLLAVTLGGVSSLQINALYLGLISYLILLTGFGILCSTLGSNNRVSAMYMIIGLCGYTVIPLVIKSILPTLGSLKASVQLVFILDLIIRFSAFQQMGMILTTGFGDPTLSWQVLSNTFVGIGCFFLAWALFGYSTRNPSSEAITRVAVPMKSTRFRQFAPTRVWQNPFVWKDFYFVSGGFGMIAVRLLFCLILFCIIAAIDRRGTAISAFQVFLSLAVAIDAARVLAGSIYDERRGQTLASLVMLPRWTPGILYSKLTGALLSWLPAAAILLLVSIGTWEGSRNLAAIFNDSAGLPVVSFFVLIPHLSFALATMLRWGAVPLATGIVLGMFFTLMPTFSSSAAAITMVGVFNTCLCICCHFVLVSRFQSLATR